MEICQLLRETRLKDVVAPRRIHSVSTNTPIAAALQSLCDHRVLSAPVFVAPADRLPTEDLRGSDVDAVPPIVKGLVGVVDVGDVLSELLTRK